MRIGLMLSVVLLGMALVGVESAATEIRPAAASQLAPAPVASLEPAKTEELWRRLVSARKHQTQTPADCRPLRAVFWAATDYLRLATTLAATPSPCAEYYVSIPPIVGDKTRPRPNAASRVRALGPNFHAMAEFHFTSWNRWVQSTGSSWYTAGVTARERMAAAGYDMSQGDIWVVNELSTAVRRNVGNARTNIRELLRGLYEGGEGGRPTRGAVLIVGVGQRSTSDTSLLQTNLQNWYTDTAFWEDVSRYTSDWSQEVYGDVRSLAVPGAPQELRRDYLNEYLQHPLVLAGAGPPTIDLARAHLQSAYSPLANAAWEREAGYGWTMVSPEQMSAYVSAQIHALRYFSATTGQPQDRWGFAWAPRNGTGKSVEDFTAQSGQVLERLATAIRDSAVTTEPANPGSAACGPPAQNLYCVVDLEGARFNEAWKSFRTWTQPVLQFATPAQTIPAGSPSAAMSLQLVTSSGLAATTPVSLALTVTSSSPGAAFSTTLEGPWMRTLPLAIAAGTRTTVPFYYQDTRSGSHTLTATALGVTSGTQVVTVTPGAPTVLALTPRSGSVQARASRELAASARDAFGNVFPVVATWSLRPQSIGKLATANGNINTFTAGRVLGQATVSATVATPTGTLTAAAQLRVTPARLRIGAITYLVRNKSVFVSISARDAAGSFVSRARISALVNRNGRPYTSARAETGAAGRVTFRIPAPRLGGCLSTKIRRVTAAGFAWDGRTPRNRRCFLESR